MSANLALFFLIQTCQSVKNHPRKFRNVGGNMTLSVFIPPTPEQRRAILAEYGFEYDARIRESVCKQMTSLSRSRRWSLELVGAFPARHSLGRCSCTWLLSDVLWWLRHPPVIADVNNPYENARKKKQINTDSQE